MNEYQQLLADGWEENGEIQCAIHGGDHSAIILVHPNDPDTFVYVCKETYEVYN